nr:2-keto-3-deoxygluconate permease [Klebsiella pneumoniae]
MNINILEKMNKVPGGLIIIPLLVAILINTFAPQVLSIGGPTTALFKVGSSAMMGIFCSFAEPRSISVRPGCRSIKAPCCCFSNVWPGHWRCGLRERCLARAVFSEYRPWR